MAESTYEFTGKSVDEAVADALAQLKVTRSDVAVEVLNKGSRGIFGIGSEPARIRVTVGQEPVAAAETAPAVTSSTPRKEVNTSAEATAQNKPATKATDEPVTQEEAVVEKAVVNESKDEVAESEEQSVAESETRTSDQVDNEVLAQMASEMLSEIVRLMGFDAEVVSSWLEQDGNDPSNAYLLLDIEGEDLGALIGRRGETLASLQYLVRLMVNQRIKQWRNIVVDVEKYKERRETQLTQLALRMADQVAESGRAAALEPMPANERRLVHLALRDHELVYTQSSGEGDRRKVNIVPRDTA